MRYHYVIYLFFLYPTVLMGISYQNLTGLLNSEQSTPFTYSLDLKILQGSQDDEPVMLCFHGYGSSSKMGEILRTYKGIPHHIISFNFPDYNLKPNQKDPHQTTFGTIQELLPALYLLKKMVIDGQINRVDLYGFSAGGGALINVLAVLNSNRFNKELSDLGIFPSEKRDILRAVENGSIVLDCPLKSIEEIIACRGNSNELDILNQRYKNNQLVPIDSLENLENLSLKILVHFQMGDRALSNRDDQLYIERLRDVNRKGMTFVLIGNDGGHVSYHKSLWEQYPKFLEADVSSQISAIPSSECLPFRGSNFFIYLTQPSIRFAHCRLGCQRIWPSALRKLTFVHDCFLSPA